MLDPGREQVHYLSDARRTHVRPTGRRIDSAEVGVAVHCASVSKNATTARLASSAAGFTTGATAELAVLRRPAYADLSLTRSKYPAIGTPTIWITGLN